MAFTETNVRSDTSPAAAGRLSAVRRDPRGTATAWAVLMIMIALFLPVAPASAGEGGYRGCTADAQACLDMMVKKLSGRAWLGIEYDDSRGPAAFTIERVVPGSPAEKAGFRPKDILYSVEGVRFADNREDRCGTCEATRDVWKPGARLVYVVLRNDRKVTLKPTLGRLPTEVMHQMIGMHMLEHAQAPSASKSP